PVIGVPVGLEIAPKLEVEMLAENNRRGKIHESIGRFLAVIMPEPQLIEIENAHHMDEASAELLSYLIGELDSKPWLFAVARRPSSGGVTAPRAPTPGPGPLPPPPPPGTPRLPHP